MRVRYFSSLTTTGRSPPSMASPDHYSFGEWKARTPTVTLNFADIGAISLRAEATF
jgi:hypothetical protein